MTSGSSSSAAKKVSALYSKIVDAGIHEAQSIKVAEAAKVIENTQRDLNIALINELAMLFRRLGIDTGEVLEAAATKWNFFSFQPGLVGGHCIGVDPYYLAHKSLAIGFDPKVIMAGRKTNEGMGEYVANQLLDALSQNTIQTKPRVLMLGLAFKENCPDIRNTGVINVIRQLEVRGCDVDVFDPWVSRDEAIDSYGIKMLIEPTKESYDAICVAVAHNEFRDLGIRHIRAFGKTKHVLFDLKHVFDKNDVDIRL